MPERQAHRCFSRGTVRRLDWRCCIDAMRGSLVALRPSLSTGLPYRGLQPEAPADIGWLSVSFSRRDITAWCNALSRNAIRDTTGLTWLTRDACAVSPIRV